MSRSAPGSRPPSKARRPADREPARARSAAPPPRRPYWIFAAIAGVIAVVAYAKISEAPAEVIESDVELHGAPTPPERLRVRIVNRFPHDREAFTQGLLWHDGHLYESTGLRGQSTLRKVALESGEVLGSRALERRFFAEGLARVGDRLFQLTWEEGVCHVWSLDGFEHERTFEYQGEGWGLCYDGEHLVMSDGSAQLAFRDPRTFAIRRVVTVRNAGRPLRNLNELECVDGAVWANVWGDEHIVRVDPRDGRVTGIVDASGLLSAEEEDFDTDVLNGIAWIESRGHFVITGKRWPTLFEVDFVPADEGTDG